MKAHPSLTRSLSLTIRETCQYTGLSRSTIYNLAKAGTLPIHKIAGRSLILRRDILALFKLTEPTPSEG